MNAQAEAPATVSSERPEEFWRAAWEAERGALLGFLRRQVRDRETAEDLLQETFVRAIRSGRIEERASLRSYLFTIAQNLLTDHWRKRLRLVGPSGSSGWEPFGTHGGPDDQDGVLERIADQRSESPEARTARRGLEQRVREALALLPDSYRAAFRLAAIEERSYREVGEAMGWSLGQVRINVHRARKRLIAELGAELVAEMRG
jgi:RNA polymerase sigma-70 factor (ECF subfamily)